MGTPMTTWSSGGAIDEEAGAWNGTTIRLTKTGVLQGPACDSVEKGGTPVEKEYSEEFDQLRRSVGTVGTPINMER